MALSPADSSAAFPAAGKELDVQIHFSLTPFSPCTVLHRHPWHGLVQLEHCSPARCGVQGTPRPEDAAHGRPAAAPRAAAAQAARERAQTGRHQGTWPAVGQYSTSATRSLCWLQGTSASSIKGPPRRWHCFSDLMGAGWFSL